MSLTQELDDACDDLGSKIILTTNALEEDILPNITLSSNQLSTPPQTFLRVGKPGKLFLKPNYTAFTKTNLGSIPSKVEKTLLKTEESIPITLTLNKHVQKINIPEKEENFSRSFSTSYSSRGYGVGFVSKVPRFNYDRKIIYPGPGDYSPEKKDSMENDINKSIFGKSMFSKKSDKSLQILKTSEDKFYTSQEILSLLRKNYNQRYSNSLNNNNKENINSKNNTNSDTNKGSYFFESKVKKFNRGIFNINNKNPGPGKYFIDTNFKIKHKDKKSPYFIESNIKKEDPLKTYGISKDDEKKIGFNLIGSNRGGRVTNFWNGSPSLGYSYDFGKTLKNIKDNKTRNISESKLKNKILNLPDNNMSNNLKNLGTLKKKYLINEYLYMNKSQENQDKFNNFQVNTDITKKGFNKFKKKDYFALSSPRWEEGNFHDNESHFQIPGPAYYEPKEQLLKRSFNLNKKDFIYTNGVPFLEKKYSDL